MDQGEKMIKIMITVVFALALIFVPMQSWEEGQYLVSTISPIMIVGLWYALVVYKKEDKC